MFDSLKPLAASPVVRGVVVAAVIYALLTALGRTRSSRIASRWSLALAFVLAAAGLAASAAVTLTNVQKPREWDFLCFWTYGQALAGGESPYDVPLLRKLAAPHQPSDEFLRETYCLYPPPCVIQFAPLGLLSLPAAALFWYAVQWAAALACVVLVARALDERPSAAAWATALALLFGSRATISTFGYAQTNFLILLGLLYAQASNKSLARGIALGLVTVVKPLGAIMGLQLLVRRDWKALAGMAVPVCIAFALFLALQGAGGARMYFDRNPLTEDIAAVFYTEPVNQSLLATLLRVSGVSPGPRPLLFPPFLVIAGLMTLATMAVTWRLPKAARLWALPCFTALALLVYPGALGHYSVLLLLPFAVLWRQRAVAPGGAQTVIVTIALALGLVWARQEFWANLIVWFVAMVAATQARADLAGALGGRGRHEESHADDCDQPAHSIANRKHHRVFAQQAAPG